MGLVMRIFFFLMTIIFMGCSSSIPLTKPTIQENHLHKPGINGGNIVSIGRDNYHAEAIFAEKGVVKIFMMGRDETRIQYVESQVLEAYARVEGDTEDLQVNFEPVNEKNGPLGKTSQFIGKLPERFWGKVVSITIPIRIEGEYFRFRISSKQQEHDDMPIKTVDDKERELYLTAGGLYTKEDIKANGNTVASRKYKGIIPKHDTRPKTGDKICPISMTKANPNFTWIIGGKTYEFCCPPCIDEFLKLAKEHPEEIKEPDYYTKK